MDMHMCNMPCRRGKALPETLWEDQKQLLMEV